MDINSLGITGFGVYVAVWTYVFQRQGVAQSWPKECLDIQLKCAAAARQRIVDISRIMANRPIYRIEPFFPSPIDSFKGDFYCEWDRFPDLCERIINETNEHAACLKRCNRENIPDSWTISYTPILAIGLGTVVALLANKILVDRRIHSARSMASQIHSTTTRTDNKNLEPAVTKQDQMESLESDTSSDWSLDSE